MNPLLSIKGTIISGFVLAIVFIMILADGSIPIEAEGYIRWLHYLSGVTWIGLLYYFNFVQTEYVKVADPDAKADVMKKLAPNALWWFRWAAFFTFLTGLILFYQITARIGTEIILGATMGTLMMLNVWGIIWRNQKIVLGMKEGDVAAAAAKAGLASRTNTLLSLPMLLSMVAAQNLY